MTINPLQVVARTPKTNCGECGYPTCLAFGAAVSQGTKPPDTCPYINLEGLEFSQSEPSVTDPKERDLEFITHLKQKISPLDMGSIAGNLGAVCSGENHDILFFQYLGQDAAVSKATVTLDGEEPEDHRDQILLYNYIHGQGAGSLAGEWIGMESLPNSISKIKTLETYCEKRLASLFTGKNPHTLHSVMQELQAIPVSDHTADLGVIIPVLPKIPQYILFWEEEPEDHFEAKVKVLFDKNVLDFLDIESLVFTAERLADRIAFLINDSHSS